MREISVKEIENIRIGSAENKEAATGCTVIICENGAPAGLDVRGGGPASRETELLKPLANADRIHAVLVSGGSAYGLDAAGGVMANLEERGIGLEVGVARVPLVCQSCLFDLAVGDSKVRPDKAMGYEACENAWIGVNGNYEDGNVGAGTGATVGKALGAEFCMKAGIGSYAVQVGPLKVGAIVAVNAIGDIYDWKNGQKVAGLLGPDKKSFRSTEELFYQGYEAAMAAVMEQAGAAGQENAAGQTEAAMAAAETAGNANNTGLVTNTTIGVIITNGKFDKSQLCKIAGMTHNGYARSIRPVHTSMDGDSIYAMSVGEVPADKDMVGTLAAQVMSEAILRAVQNADSAYGLVAAKDF